MLRDWKLKEAQLRKRMNSVKGAQKKNLSGARRPLLDKVLLAGWVRERRAQKLKVSRSMIMKKVQQTFQPIFGREKEATFSLDDTSGRNRRRGRPGKRIMAEIKTQELRSSFVYLQEKGSRVDIALQSASVTEIDRDTLMEVLSRSQLDPSSELVIFHAAEAWAEAECERRKILQTVDNLRTCLGPALQLVRFPLMNVNEFGQAASSSLLNCEEIAEVFLHLTVKPRPYCRYPSGFRCFSRSKHTVTRFSALSSKDAPSIYGIAPVSKPHIAYVDEKAPVDWSCQVEIQLASVVDPCTYGSSVCHSATNNVVLNGLMGDSTPCVAYFEEPVQCSANTTYVASIRFISETGVQTFQGKDGQDAITVDLPFDESVTFKFQSYRNAYGNDDGGKAEGQIPSLHFLVPWPRNQKMQ